MPREADDMEAQDKKGEQGIFPLTIRPNQSLLVEELKPKFENIDRRFDSSFERMYKFVPLYTNMTRYTLE